MGDRARAKPTLRVLVHSLIHNTYINILMIHVSCMASERSERDTLRSAQLRIARYIYLYHRYNGNSHVIKVIISLLNFLWIRYHPWATFSVFPMV